MGVQWALGKNATLREYSALWGKMRLCGSTVRFEEKCDFVGVLYALGENATLWEYSATFWDYGIRPDYYIGLTGRRTDKPTDGQILVERQY